MISLSKIPTSRRIICRVGVQQIGRVISFSFRAVSFVWRIHLSHHVCGSTHGYRGAHVSRRKTIAIIVDTTSVVRSLKSAHVMCTHARASRPIVFVPSINRRANYFRRYRRRGPFGSPVFGLSVFFDLGSVESVSSGRGQRETTRNQHFPAVRTAKGKCSRYWIRRNTRESNPYQFRQNDRETRSAHVMLFLCLSQYMSYVIAYRRL